MILVLPSQAESGLSVGKGGDAEGNATVTPMVERGRDPPTGLRVISDQLSRAATVLPHRDSSNPRNRAAGTEY